MPQLSDCPWPKAASRQHHHAPRTLANPKISLQRPSAVRYQLLIQ